MEMLHKLADMFTAGYSDAYLLLLKSSIILITSMHHRGICMADLSTLNLTQDPNLLLTCQLVLSTMILSRVFPLVVVHGCIRLHAVMSEFYLASECIFYSPLFPRAVGCYQY